MSIRLARAEAQALAVIASGLDRPPARRRVTRAEILRVIETLGCVQLDTISVISRSHETVFWSRLGPYDVSLLPALYAPDGQLTEYMAHAAAILHRRDLPLFRPFMERARPQNRHDPDGRIAATILDRLHEDGPLCSDDFAVEPGSPAADSWDWWGRKPERAVLNRLWWQGRAAVHLRDARFRRYYDLPENVVPGFWELPRLSDDETARQLTRRALRALGITTARWASDYWRAGGAGYVRSAHTRRLLDNLMADGEAVSISVDGISEPLWLDAVLLPRLEALRQRSGWPTRTTFLSPFDNLIWNRQRMTQLWGMHYRIEIYVKEADRVYGYYSMPILHRGQLVGRIDPSFHRQSGLLTIRRLHLDPGVVPRGPLVSAIGRALNELLRFLGGSGWVVTQSDPPGMVAALTAWQQRAH